MGREGGRAGGVEEGGREVEEKGFLSRREASGASQDKPYCRALLPLASRYVSKQCKRSGVQKTKKKKEKEETLRRRASPLIPPAAGLRGALRGRCTPSHASKRLHSHSFCNDKMLTPSEGENTEREQLPGKLSYVWEKLILLMKPGCTDSGAVYPPGQMKLIRVWRGE